MPEKDDPSKSPIATKIETLGEQGDKILGAIEGAGTKFFKKLASLIGALGIGSYLVYQAVVAFQDKTRDVFQKNGVEKVEVKSGSSVFKVKGRSGSSGTAEPKSQPEK